MAIVIRIDAQGEGFHDKDTRDPEVSYRRGIKVPVHPPNDLVEIPAHRSDQAPTRALE